MDYYEEFGIRSTASPEEVRQTYKAVTRLLHPDGQPDARLKLVAECQMKRANEIFGILLDPQRRLLYDHSLNRDMALTAPPRPWPAEDGAWMRLARRHWFWFLIVAIIFGSGLWYVQAGGSSGAEVVPVSSPDRDRPAADTPSFAGDWSYSPRGDDPDPDHPRDVELRLEEKSGAFQGSYREWYRVPSLAASPGIVFQVQGRSAGGESAILDWESDDGSRGEMDLVMQTPDTMRAIWWATRLGRGTGLSSGASILIRQPEP
ncbi:MAG: DnaJ domain-containing protein [Bryobacteraceae bacterium]|jgi:curved DNA-binding protein CbpA